MKNTETSITQEQAFAEFFDVNNTDVELDYIKVSKPCWTELEKAFNIGLPNQKVSTDIDSVREDIELDKGRTLYSRDLGGVVYAVEAQDDGFLNVKEKKPVINCAPVYTLETLYGKAQEIIEEELVALEYGSEPRRYPHGTKTAYPKADSSQYSFDDQYDKRNKEHGAYLEFFNSQKEIVSRCCYYAVNRFEKDWTVQVYGSRQSVGYLKASVFISRQPFNTTHEIEMLKLAIKSFLSSKHIIKTDSYNDDNQAEVIFNGI